MLDNQTINDLTTRAKPVAYKTLRSYIRWAPSVRYVKETMLPALRRQHASIWSRTTTEP